VKISGFTFIRNGRILGYPFVESIRSLLPLCDEVIVNVPQSDDDTLAVVQSIRDPKIRVIQSEWDPTMKERGLILSHHTNLALDQCTGDWRVYIQGDEVLHEESIPSMRDAMERSLAESAVQGLLVDYSHFYGSYWTQVYSFGWYYKEIRVVRRDAAIRSVGDAQSFRRNSEKLYVKNSGGKYFHYGHALKPAQARAKFSNLCTLYDDSSGVQRQASRPARYYDDDQKVKQFTGTHPAVMKEAIANADWTYESRNPLIRFRKEYFWEDIALIVKRLTGISVGVHRNYRLIK
jgi:hypothetical protein